MSREAKRSKALEDESYVYAGLFGLDFRDTMRVLRRLLKPFGLEIKTRGRVHGDDSSYVKISGDNAIKAAIEVWQRFLDWGPTDDGSPEGKALEKALTDLRDALPAHPRNNRKLNKWQKIKFAFRANAPKCGMNAGAADSYAAHTFL